MRLTTWNVNGIRNPFSYPPWNTARTFPAMFDTLESDIVVMQELKIQRKDLRDDMVLIDGWDCYFSLPKHKKGYSGVGIYTRNAVCAPVKAEEGLLGVLPSSSGVPYCELPEKDSIGGYPNALQVAELGIDAAMLDAEGRCVVVEFPAFVLLGVYSPANSNGMRDDFRHGFINALDCRIRNLIRMGKRVVLVGDLNVSRDENDTAGAFDDCRKEGITHAEYISTPNRRVFNQLLVGGEVIGERDEGRESGVLLDTCRMFHPGRKGMYTHWEQKKNARPGNFGSRIDFVLVSESMQTWIKDANIQEGLLGSDHCPVFADFNDVVTINDQQEVLIDIMSPPGTFEDGKRLHAWSVQHVPGFSAKRLPEFSQRRSIMSMFTAPKVKKSESAELTPTVSTQSESVITETKLDDATLIEAHESRGSPPSDFHAARHQTPEQDTSIPSLKRKVSSTPKEKLSKKQKAGSVGSASKGQQSLKGFFQSSSARNSETPGVLPLDDTGAAVHAPRKASNSNGTIPSAAAIVKLGQRQMTNECEASPVKVEPSELESLSRSATASPSPSEVSAMFEANEQTQRSWGALFAKPAAPLCESHNEPCKTMLTKKKGSNQGRSFWMCARPLGPTGDKERGTQWRCPTFIWCSDWGGRKEKSQGDS